MYWDYQSWVFIGRTDAEAETPILWPPHVKSWLTGKDSDDGRDSGQAEKGMTEDEMAGWHHRFDGRESEWTPGDGDGQGGLACCDSWGHKESDTTEWLNWTEPHPTWYPVRFFCTLQPGLTNLIQRATFILSCSHFSFRRPLYPGLLKTANFVLNTNQSWSSRVSCKYRTGGS